MKNRTSRTGAKIAKIADLPTHQTHPAGFCTRRKLTTLTKPVPEPKNTTSPQKTTPTPPLKKSLKKQLKKVDILSNQFKSKIPAHLHTQLSDFQKETYDKLLKEQQRINAHLAHDNHHERVKIAYQTEKDIIATLEQKIETIRVYWYTLGQCKQFIDSIAKDTKETLTHNAHNADELDAVLEGFNLQVQKITSIDQFESDFHSIKRKINNTFDALESQKIATEKIIQAEKEALIQRADLVVTQIHQITSDFAYHPDAVVLKDTACKKEIDDALQHIDTAKQKAQSQLRVLKALKKSGHTEYNAILSEILLLKENVSHHMIAAKYARDMFIESQKSMLEHPQKHLTIAEKFKVTLDAEMNAVNMIANKKEITLLDLKTVRKKVNHIARLACDNDGISDSEHAIENIITSKKKVLYAKQAFSIDCKPEHDSLKALRTIKKSVSVHACCAKNMIGIIHDQPKLNVIQKINSKLYHQQTHAAAIGHLIQQCDEYLQIASNDKTADNLNQKVKILETLKAIAQGKHVFDADQLVDIESTRCYQYISLTDSEKLEMASCYWAQSDVRDVMAKNHLAAWENPIIAVISTILAITVIGLIFSVNAMISFKDTGSAGFWRSPLKNKLHSGEVVNDIDHHLMPISQCTIL